MMTHTDSPLIPLCAPYPYSRPYEVLAAKNATLRLRAPDGKVYTFTDLMCAHGAVNFGHMNPAIDPFTSLTSDLTACFYPPSATNYATWLLNKLKLKNYSVLYRIGVASAVSSAIAVAQHIRPGKILKIEGSSHGHGGNSSPEASNGRPASIGHASFTDSQAARHLDAKTLSIPAGGEFSAWEEVSCLLYEPIQSGSGYAPLPLAWLRTLSQSARDAGVTVIADETESGFYRFGFLSTAQQENLNPDIYLFGKSLTNGIYPTSVVVCPQGLERALTAADGCCEPTFQSSSLGPGAAEAVAAYIDSTDVAGKIAVIHGLLADSVEVLARNPALCEFHLAGPTLSLEVRNGRASEVILKCEERGVLVSGEASGRRIRIAPPITIPEDHLTAALEILLQAAHSL
jgi:acetylornithine/succinyldiaminopimelate/putrescine aminotransferase